MATNDNSKIVSLDSYRSAPKVLTRENIRTVLSDQQDQIRIFDEKVLALLSHKHKLKDIQIRKDRSVRIEQTLVAISDWLEVETDRATGADKPRYEALQKECERLFTRHERIKRNIGEDLAACRHIDNKYAFDPTKVAGFAAGTPLTFAALTKLLVTDDEATIVAAAKVGGAVGLILGFHRQLRQVSDFVVTTVTERSMNLGNVSKVMRASFAAAALQTAVTTTRVEDIEPRRAVACKYGALVRRVDC